jgi:site-specific recombinase XerD
MTAPLITIFVRHAADCKYAGDEFSKRCDCRKHFRWSANGEQHRRKAGTRSWAEAEEVKRHLEDELAGRVIDIAKPSQDIGSCIEVFLQDKRVQGLSADAIAKYKRELTRLKNYCEQNGVFNVQGISREHLTGYCATWETIYPSSQTRSIVRARCRGFLRYCYEAQWLPRIPPMPKIKVDVAPTLPLTPEQLAALLKATEVLDPGVRVRAHALFRLMRFSGLAVGDSLKLQRAELKRDTHYRIETSRQKTGVHVSIPIPDDVSKELLALPSEWIVAANGSKHAAHPDYFFWDGKNDIVNTWTRKIVPKVFAAAEIARGGNMTSHRLRDTFAVDLLEKGVPMEEVSRLLGHKSIRTTEKHYAKWSKGRQDRVDSLVTGTWAKPKKARRSRSESGSGVAA